MISVMFIVCAHFNDTCSFLRHVMSSSEFLQQKSFVPLGKYTSIMLLVSPSLSVADLLCPDLG